MRCKRIENGAVSVCLSSSICLYQVQRAGQQQSARLQQAVLWPVMRIVG